MVEIEAHKAQEEEAKTTTLDINDIVNKIGDFAKRIKELSTNGKELTSRLDNFNFSIDRTTTDMYEITVKLNVTLKPKKITLATILPTCNPQ